eukprot:ANDGO_06652.mRNA.1 hypothetical protein
MSEYAVVHSYMKVRRESFLLKKWRDRWCFWDPIRSHCMYIAVRPPQDVEYDYDSSLVDLRVHDQSAPVLRPAGTSRMLKQQQHQQHQQQLQPHQPPGNSSPTNAAGSGGGMQRAGKFGDARNAKSDSSLMQRRAVTTTHEPGSSTISAARARDMYAELAASPDAYPVFLVPGATRVYAPSTQTSAHDVFSFCIDNSQLDLSLRDMMGTSPKDWVVDFLCPDAHVYRLWMAAFIFVSEKSSASLFRDALPSTVTDPTMVAKLVQRGSIFSQTQFDHCRVEVTLVCDENPSEALWEPLVLITRPSDTLAIVSIRLRNEYVLDIKEFRGLDPRITMRELGDMYGNVSVTGICTRNDLMSLQDRLLQRANLLAGSPFVGDQFSPSAAPTAADQSFFQLDSSVRKVNSSYSMKKQS